MCVCMYVCVYIYIYIYFGLAASKEVVKEHHFPSVPPVCVFEFVCVC